VHAVAQPTRVRGLGASSKVSEAGEKLLHARAADVERAHTRAAHRLEKDEVHALRVACRRLRAAVKVFGKKELRRTDPLVEHLQDALGEVRDLQLKTSWLSSNGGTALAEQEQRKLDAAEATLRKALSLWSLRSAPKVLGALPAVHRRGHLGGARQRTRLRKRLRALAKRLERPRPIEPSNAHALRIEAKKLRYEAELLADAFDVAELIEAVKKLQDAFGDLHDADVRIELTQRDPRLRRIALRERAKLARAAQDLLARWRQDDVVKRFGKAV
jgi:CHAD domain-containing protein